METNKEILRFFTEQYKPAAIGLIGTNDPVGIAIRNAQRSITADGNPSFWSHCFLFGSLRLDRREKDGETSRSPYIFESDLHADLKRPLIMNGAQENWIGKWCGNNVEHAACIDFSLSSDERDGILATALQLVSDQIQYPVHELLGTWWSIIVNEQWQQNPLDSPHAMHCSSFVRYCYKTIKRDFLDHTVSISNTAPEDIARAGTQADVITLFR
jgi:hypothetical protein